MNGEDYYTHTEADAGLWARAHAEPDDDKPSLSDVADDEACPCGQYGCPAFGAAAPPGTTHDDLR